MKKGLIMILIMVSLMGGLWTVSAQAQNSKCSSFADQGGSIETANSINCVGLSRPLSQKQQVVIENDISLKKDFPEIEFRGFNSLPGDKIASLKMALDYLRTDSPDLLASLKIIEMNTAVRYSLPDAEAHLNRIVLYNSSFLDLNRILVHELTHVKQNEIMGIKTENQLDDLGNKAILYNEGLLSKRKFRNYFHDDFTLGWIDASGKPSFSGDLLNLIGFIFEPSRKNILEDSATMVEKAYFHPAELNLDISKNPVVKKKVQLLCDNGFMGVKERKSICSKL